MMHRDKLEKERIIKRNEKHVKNVVVDNLLVDKRFNNDEGNKYLRKSDAAYEDFKIREKQKLKEYIKIENKRKENLQRHENKWAQIDLNVQKEVEKTNRLQQMPFKSEKNKSKCSHDIINHQYINYEESMKMERKKNNSILNRRNFLSEKINGSYNPITGEKRN
ncbi:conserved Plasmodium protein, unknown function [Plasmodium reichenowi]|uniref:Uncharacterized protein n=1 Tax=Plasmodium reichenowi TaxID=5854 RepID=A0A2P9DHI7_PLARE|nr:conserved Plasmodium protein, unknown function [Plasmodium reichenowi]